MIRTRELYTPCVPLRSSGKPARTARSVFSARIVRVHMTFIYLRDLVGGFSSRHCIEKPDLTMFSSR